MRKGNFRGRVFYFTEAEHRKLLQRFDVKNAKKRGGAFIIFMPCSLCTKYQVAWGKICGDCPLSQFKDGCHEGCTVLLDKQFGIFNSPIRLTETTISWLPIRSASAVKVLTQIHTALLSMEWVRRRKE